MFSTLRRRLILSHVLPLLVIIPVMGIALIYVLETKVLLADLSRELTGNAVLITDLASEKPDLWHDPPKAQAFVDHVSQHLTTRVMLLDTQGRLLASNESEDARRIGQTIDLPPLTEALAGKVSVRTTYSQYLQTEIVDVWAPVFGPNQQVIGIVRVSHKLASVQEQFLRMRYLIAGVLIGGLLLGGVIGLILALNMERPLQQVTQAIYRLASGQELMPLAEEGPEEIRLLAHAFNTLVERLRSLERARRQLLANLVHELGRPLGALRSATRALRDGAYKDATLRQELLVGMAEEIDLLHRLLDDLAHLHDQVVGPLELDRRPVTLSEWLPRVLIPWRETAYKKGLHWQAVIPNTLPSLELDPDRLAQVLGNLLSNATKYTPRRGTVSVTAGVEDSAVWIRVSDTGPGMTPEEQVHVFNRFYRGSQAGRFPQGMGLGLSIARDLVIAHGGRLEVESALGRGSHFTVWIPLEPNKISLPQNDC
jgi:two-component system sensor histidine kinase BaeS